MANKWMRALSKIDGAVDRSYNPYDHGVRSGIPGVDWLFGNSNLLPAGLSLITYGPEKSGKSLLCNAFIGQVHRDTDDGIVIKFNTEQRELAQLTPHYMDIFGIDPERYVAYDVKNPEQVFDVIENQIAALCADGAPIRLAIIDSVTGILGRRQMAAEGVMTQQRGDKASTIQEGLERIQAVIRKHKIALIMTSQLRDEQDPTEIMRGNKTRMAGAHALRHFAEYFMLVEPNKTVDGRKDMSGEELVNENFKDFKDRAEMTGHHIRVTMKDSSVGPKGRKAEFTFDYGLGIINQHEEVFTLGVRRRIVDKPTQSSYQLSNFPEEGQVLKFVGRENFLNAIKERQDLADEIMRRVRLQDIVQQKTGRLPVFGDTDDEEQKEVVDEESAE